LNPIDGKVAVGCKAFVEETQLSLGLRAKAKSRPSTADGFQQKKKSVNIPCSSATKTVCPVKSGKRVIVVGESLSGAGIVMKSKPPCS